MNSILILYRTRARRRGDRGSWRWRVLDHRNRRIIGASTEGYRDRKDAARNYDRLTDNNLPGLLKWRRPVDAYAWLILTEGVPRDERPTFRPLPDDVARSLARG